MIRIKRPFLLTALTLLFTQLLLMTGHGVAVKIFIVLLPVIFIVTCIRKMAISKALLLMTAAVVVASLSFSYSTAVYEKEALLAGYNKTVAGTVTEITYDENGFISGAVLSDCTVNDTAISSKIRIYTNNNARFSYGDSIALTAFRLTANESERLFRYHSLSDKISLNAYSSKNTGCVITDTSQKILSFIGTLRERTSRKLSSSDDEIKGISDALITGNKESLTDSFTVNLRKCGISHIFAVSGMHLAFWTGLFFLILKNKARVSFIPNLSASAFVLFYVVFTGFSPSVMRAGIMLLIVFLGRILKKAADTLNTLGIAGTVLLTVNPFLAGNISFLLSFTATAAIILWNDYLFEERSYPKGKHQFIKARLQTIKRNILTSFGVVLTTLPLTSVFFGYISLISPVVSLAATPLAIAIMISSLIQLLIPGNAFLYKYAQGLTELFCSLLSRLVSFFAQMDFTIISVKPAVVLPVFIITAAVCAVVIVFIKNRRLSLICALSGVLIFTGTVAADTYIHRNETCIYIAGEENSTLISVVAPLGSHTTVYGAGGSYNQFYKLRNYLSSKGILTADLLFIPRDVSTENENSEHIKENLLPEACIYAPEGEYKSSISKGTELYSVTTADFAASVFTINGIKAVVCTLPSSDFTTCEETFTFGDILICRSAIPKTVNADNFSDIIIMTDPSNAAAASHISTKSKDIEIIIKGDSYAIN